MNLSDIQFIFNRALVLTWDRKKLLLMFIVLSFCGLLVVFFKGLAVQASQWVLMSLTFLPIFLCAGVLLSTGIFLTRVYHDEVKNKEVSYSKIMGKSWDVVIGASYFTIPIILCYLLLWMMLGLFILLRETPGLGYFFSIIFAFGPFLLNLGSLVLCGLNISMLFFVAPVIALRGLNRIRVSQLIVKRLSSDIFTNILLAFVASIPFLFSLVLLILSAVMTGSLCYKCHDPIQTVLQWFFIMIPFVAFLSPSIVFFFNFAAESHVFMKKKHQKEKG